MNLFMRCSLIPILILCACAASAEEKEWSGMAWERLNREKKWYDCPMLDCGKMEYYMLAGKVVAVEELKKHRYYVVKGTLSADGKTITVSSMRLREEFTGALSVWMQDGKEQYGLVIGGRGWHLTGKLAPAGEMKNGAKWTVKGTESPDGGKSIDVVEMKKVE